MTEMDCGAVQEDVHQFINDCKNFLIESVIQIQKIFYPDSELLGMVECISPQKASARVPSSLSDIVRNRPYLSELDPSQLDLEWREHSLKEKVSQDLHWDEYWNIVKNIKRPSRELKSQR